MTIYKATLLIFAVCTISLLNAYELPDDFKAVWAGVEVMGTDKQTAQKVRELLPIPVGEKFIFPESERYRQQCQQFIKNHISKADFVCEFVLFSDGVVYQVVDFIPVGKKPFLRKLPIKKGKVASLPSSLNTLHDQWDARMSLLAASGNFPREKPNTDFIDFEDPQLHNFALQLHQETSKYNTLLLDILHYSQDVQARRKAATLLSWSGDPENLVPILKWDLLSDPDMGVRNNLARASAVFIANSNNKSLLKKLLPLYCQHATLPEHTDRNKALSALFTMLKTHPELGQELNAECKATLTYISEMSILTNVGGTADDILKLLENADHG